MIRAAIRAAAVVVLSLLLSSAVAASAAADGGDGQDASLHIGVRAIAVGEPILVDPGADVTAGTVDLGRRLQAMLDRLQAQPRHQPRPGEDAPWHPAHLGGSAPTRAEAEPRESAPGHPVRWWEQAAAGPRSRRR